MKIILDELAFVKRIIKKDSGENPESFFMQFSELMKQGFNPVSNYAGTLRVQWTLP